MGLSPLEVFGRFMPNLAVPCESMKWEYKTIKLAATGFLGGKVDEVKLDSIMNDVGLQGWELAAAFDTDISGGGTRDVVVIFKRPKA